jgi:hypothetical protein
MEKQRSKQSKFTKPVVSSPTVNKNRAVPEADVDSEASRVISASPASGLSKLERIAAAQQRMKMRQSGYPDSQAFNSQMENQKTESNQELDENYIPEYIITQAKEEMPNHIRNDP